VLHIPATIAPIAVVYRFSDAPDDLRLTPEVLSAIFLGEIKTWNDPRIGQLNPDSHLPSTGIRVIHRSDGSGTTKVFTQYLSLANSGWQKRVGSGTTVSWPVGSGLNGNKGVAEYVRRTEGTVGYVSLSFARANKLKRAALWNRAGRFVTPSLDGATAAAAHAAETMPDDLRLSLVDGDGEASYPPRRRGVQAARTVARTLLPTAAA
jgi:phosphate transport system substrate-binding protein